MGSNRFLNILRSSKHMSDTQNVLFENFIRFEKSTFLELLKDFLSFCSFQANYANFGLFSNSIGSFDMNAYIKQSKGSVQRDQNKIFVEPIFI